MCDNRIFIHKNKKINNLVLEVGPHDFRFKHQEIIPKGMQARCWIDRTTWNSQPQKVTPAVKAAFKQNTVGVRDLATQTTCPLFQEKWMSRSKLRVGGVDISFFRESEVEAVLVYVIMELDLKTGRSTVLDVHSSVVKLSVEYRAGFFALREGSRIIEEVLCYHRNHPTMAVDVLMCDGNGMLHEDLCGLATIVGAYLDLPTIGVAKKIHVVPGLTLMDRSGGELHFNFSDSLAAPAKLKDLLARSEDNRVTVAVRNRHTSYQPIVVGSIVANHVSDEGYVVVSSGHKMSPGMSVQLARSMLLGEIPEPTRIADKVGRAIVGFLQRKGVSKFDPRFYDAGHVNSRFRFDRSRPAVKKFAH